MNSPYSQEFINSQKQRLLEEKDRLEKELSDVAVYNEEEGKYVPKFDEFNKGDVEDVTESADEATNYEENISITRSLVISLQETKNALQSIEDDKYGYCEDDNDYILEERLKAYPAAAVCINKGDK